MNFRAVSFVAHVTFDWFEVKNAFKNTYFSLDNYMIIWSQFNLNDKLRCYHILFL